MLSGVKDWLHKQFDMKDLGEANYILGIKLIRDRKNKLLALSQASYIDKILVRFNMENSKRGSLPFRHGIHLSKEQSPKTPEQKERMSREAGHKIRFPSWFYLLFTFFFLLKIVVILNFKSCKSVHPSLFGKPEKIWTPSQNVTTVKR